jgi:hypothetical protein
MCNLIIFLFNLFSLLSLISIYFLIFYQFGYTLFYFLFLYTSGFFFLFLSYFVISCSPSLTPNPWLKSKLEWLKITTRETVSYLLFGFKRVSITNQKHKKVFINKRIDVVLNENQLKIFSDCFIYLLATFLCISFQKLFIEKITSTQCITGYTCINKVFKLCGVIKIQNNKDAIDELVCFKFDSNQVIYNIAIFYSFYKVYTNGTQFLFIIFYKLIQSYKSIFKKTYILVVLSFLYITFILIYYFVYYFKYYKTSIFNNLLGKISFISINNIFHFVNLFLYFLTFWNIILTAEEISSNSEYIKNEMHLPLVGKISILSKDQKMSLLEFFDSKSDDDWKLLYKASINGFKSEIFHKKCDHFKNTVTIIKTSNGNVFGGYTSQSWTPTKEKYKSDIKAFIFSLANKDNRPFKIECNSNFSKFAIWCNKNYGPVFGCISHENSNQTTNNDEEENSPLHCELTLVSDILIDFENDNYSTKVSECYSNQYLDDLIQQDHTNMCYLSGGTGFQILDIEVYWIKSDFCSCC